MADVCIPVHWLPLTISVIIPLTFLTSYCIAVGLNHVEPGFPYISDTGATSPESCIFGQFLNIAAVFVCFHFYVRYLQVEFHLSHHDNTRLRKANKVSLVFGVLTGLGMSMVGNFQETNVLAAHLIGAALTFGVGCIYAWIHTAISYKTCPYLSNLATCHLRAAMSFIISVTFFLTFLLDGLAKHNYHGTNPRKWYPKDGGFKFHVVSTASEWIMACAMLVYFLSFVSEFRRIRIRIPNIVPVPLTNSGLVADDDDDVPIIT